MTAGDSRRGNSPPNASGATDPKTDALFKVRVGNPFVAERTGKCGLRCPEPIRRGDNCVIVSSRRTEGARAIVHLTCAQKDPRLKGQLRDLTVDDLFADTPEEEKAEP
jgi:hypothetical protein